MLTSHLKLLFIFLPRKVLNRSRLHRTESPYLKMQSLELFVVHTFLLLQKFKSPEMLRHVAGTTIRALWSVLPCFIISIPLILDCWTLQMKVKHSCKTSETVYQASQRKYPEISWNFDKILINDFKHWQWITVHLNPICGFNVTVFHTVVLRISLLGTVKHNK